MKTYNESVKTAYEKRQENIIIALTGRTGSGCTTLSNILKKDKFYDLSLHNPKTYDFISRDERKYEVIYKFMGNTDHWEPFTTIEVSSIILSFVIQKGFENFKKYLKHFENPNNTNNIRIFNFDELYRSLDNLCYIFEQGSYFDFDKILNQNNDSEYINSYYDFYINKLPLLKQEFYNTIKEATCFSNKSDKFSSAELQKYNFYTYFMQQVGNNIRRSGNPYEEEYKENFYSVAERIDAVIKIIEKYNEAQNKNHNRICIDAIRNPYEAYYFKDRYSYFYLISVSTEENDRKNRLGYLDEDELKSLDLVEYDEPGREPYSIFYHQNILECLSISDIHLYNPQCEDKTFSFLTEQIVKYISLMLHPGLVCPTHIERCMQAAYSAKLNSGCLSRQVGAVITGDDFSIKAVGWNDVPEGQVPCNLRCIEDYCVNRDSKTYSPYELEDYKFQKVLTSLNSEIDKTSLLGMSYSYCFKDLYNEITNKKNQVHTRALHAEENAFLQLSKNGGQGIKGGKLFTTASPCELCAKKAFQLGIKDIYYIDPYPGISVKHILSCGNKSGPKMNLFFGAIGNAYMKLYTPRIPLKDELKLLNEIKVDEAIKNSEHRNYIKPGAKDIKYINIETSFILKSRTDIILKNKYTIEALHNDVSKFIEEILWTGSSLSEFHIIESDIPCFAKNLNCPNSPYAFEINLSKPLNEKEQVVFEYEVSAKDSNKTMFPLYIQSIPIKTDFLKIRVEDVNGILKNVNSVSFAGLESSDDQRLDSYPAEKDIEGNCTVYTYIIDKPYLNYSYAIEWDFIDNSN